MAKMLKRRFHGPCAICGVMLVTELSLEQADGRMVEVRGVHQSPGGGECSGSAKFIALWPTDRVRRRCPQGHTAVAFVGEGWMPGEFHFPIQCTERGCFAEVTPAADPDPQLVSFIAPFSCEYCGTNSPLRARRGEALREVMCKDCRMVQSSQPPSFTIADVGEGQMRIRCEVCGWTWETEEAVFRCPRPSCRSSAEEVLLEDLPWTSATA